MQDNSKLEAEVKALFMLAQEKLFKHLKQKFAQLDLLEIVRSMMQLTEFKDFGIKFWAWKEMIRVIGRHLEYCENVEICKIVEEVLNQLAKLIQKLDNNGPNPALSGLIQLFAIFVDLLTKNKGCLASISMAGSVTSITKIASGNDRQKLIDASQRLPPVIDLSDSIPESYSTSTQLSLNRSLESGQPLDGQLMLLLDQIPFWFQSFSRDEAKAHLTTFIQMFIMASDEASRIVLKGLLVKLMLSSCINVSDLFSRSLYEQIVIASVFPFSAKPTAEVYLKDLVPSLLALWRLFLGSMDGSVRLVIFCFENIVKETAFRFVNFTELSELIKKSELAPKQITGLTCAMFKSCSFKQVAEILDLWTRLSGCPNFAFKCWEIVACMGTLKVPEALHKKMAESVFSRLKEIRSVDLWPCQYKLLASLEIYARYSSCLVALEHEYLAKYQEKFLEFYQQKLPDGFVKNYNDLALIGAVVPLRFAEHKIEDSVASLLSSLSSTLDNIPRDKRIQYLGRLEECIRLCKGLE